MRQCHNCPWDSDVSLSSPYFLPGPFSLEGVRGQGVLMPGQPSLITGLSLPSQDASGAGPGECVGLGPPQLLSVSSVTLGTTLIAQPRPAFWAPGSQGVCGPSMQRVRGPSWGRGLQPEPPQDGPQRATVATLPFFPCPPALCCVTGTWLLTVGGGRRHQPCSVSHAGPPWLDGEEANQSHAAAGGHLCQGRAW